MKYQYIYPAVFSENDDGSYTIAFPDLPGCISEGKGLENALIMASSALSQWIEYLREKQEAIPNASNIRTIELAENDFASLVAADMRDTRAVRRTVSIPYWMDEKASAAGLSLSKVLQDELSRRL